MIIKIYGKQFYPSKKVCDSIFSQNGTADGYYKTDKNGVTRFFMLNGDNVTQENKILVKGILHGGYLHLLFRSVSRYELRTLKYTQDGQYMTLQSAITFTTRKTWPLWIFVKY